MNQFASLDVVDLKGWQIKASSHDGVILIIVYNPEFLWTHVRFFDSEMMAHNWIEYLIEHASIQ